MKKITVLTVVLLFNGMLCIAQDSIYILHPAIGDIIDRNEKNNFALFPEVPNTKFEYSYIRQEGNTYWLKSHLFPDSLVIRQIDTSEIHQVERNIEKIIAVSPELIKTNIPGEPGKELKSIVIREEETAPANNRVLYPSTLERISSESISNDRLRDDAEVQRLWRQGSNMDNGGLYIDFGYRKKKKK